MKDEVKGYSRIDETLDYLAELADHMMQSDEKVAKLVNDHERARLIHAEAESENEAVGPYEIEINVIIRKAPKH